MARINLFLFSFDILIEKFMKILLTGGGTGGHLIPFLSIVEELKKRKEIFSVKTTDSENLEFMFIGPAGDFNQIISNVGISVKTIKAGKLRRYLSLENLIDIFKIPIGIFQSFHFILKFKPDLVFSKGGFASVPPVFASWVLRVPIVTHESDIVPGLATKIISSFATKILISFSETRKYFKNNKVVLTGNPIRSDISNGSFENGLSFFKLSSHLPIILILGGSQGAQKVNEMILEIVPRLSQECQIIHQCGDKNYGEIKNKKKKLNLQYPERYQIYPFLKEEIKDAYVLAEVIVSRAGANSLAEIIVLKKPNILIPLSTAANNHQFKNAEFLVKKKSSLLIDETIDDSQKLADVILKLLADKNIQMQMEKNLLELQPTQNPSHKIMEEIIKVLDSRK